MKSRYYAVLFSGPEAESMTNYFLKWYSRITRAEKERKKIIGNVLKRYPELKKKLERMVAP
jgi:hypothetical protein